MPIHDLGYRHWSGQWTSHPYRWWVITRQGIALLSRKKRFMVLMILACIPFIVRGVLIYFTTVVGKSAPFLRIDGKFFADFLSQQMIFTILISIYAGAGSIANDLKANALQIYLSKPITRRDYIIGKLGTIIFFLAMPTLIPALLLFLLAALFDSSLSFVRQYYWVPASVFGYSLTIILICSLVMLALSSLSRSSRFAGINFAAAFFFSQILYGILTAIFRSTSVAWVSLGTNLIHVGDLFFGNAPRYTSPQWLSALILLSLAAGCILLIHRRVQAVEVVS